MTNDSAKPIKQGDSDRPQPISTRLRQTRANMIGTDDEQHYWDCHEAANKIDRLRSIVGLQDAAIRSGDTLALTEAEREAIQFMLRHAAHAADEPAFPDSADYRLHSEALYGLLERTANRDTTKPRNGAVDTPDSQPTPGECSTPTQCTVPPEWLQRPYLVDPPGGWRYGFPKRYDPAADGDMTQWLIANGYPERLAKQGLHCTFTACE